MSDKICVVEDFEYDTEESYFTHTPSDFRLDCDFVLLFNYDDIKRLFAVSSGDYILEPEVIEQLRTQVTEFRTNKQ